MVRESLVIVLNAGGSSLDADALSELSGVEPIWVRVEREGAVACLAARVRHPDSEDEFRVRVRGWGAARGWTVTVAPGRPPR
jgi:hypothetical protein